MGSGVRTVLAAVMLVVGLGWLGGCQGAGKNLPAPTVRPVQIGHGSRMQTLPLASPAPTVWQPGQSGPAGWIPPARLEDPDRWQGILVHHSATPSGNATSFHRAHQQRLDRNGEPWLGLGYHFVIDNGAGGPDGKVEVGFRWEEQMQGAHCRPANCVDNYWNEHTIGICLVGNFELNRPTNAQYDSLARLVKFLCNRYGIGLDRVQGHGQVTGTNTRCPGRFFSWQELRQRL